MTTLFISDLHLDPQRPDIIQEFINLLNDAQTSTGLYILGDFVEYWIGDDDHAHGLEIAFNKLRELSKTGVPIYLMHGNRDFLIGEDFVGRYNLTLLSDPTVIDLYGEPTLLMHGDTLCTDDVEYQSFREMVRHPRWQAEFLGKSLEERRTVVMKLRQTSRRETEGKPEDIMDVNQKTVEQVMREHHVRQLIHGHTHRPGVHNFTLDGQPAKRIVLGDWYQQSSVLIYTESGFTLKGYASQRV